MVFVITKQFVDYDYPDNSYTDINSVFEVYPHALERLKDVIEKEMNPNDFNSQRELEDYIANHMASDECFIEEDDYHYLEIKITEVEFYY